MTSVSISEVPSSMMLLAAAQEVPKTCEFPDDKRSKVYPNPCEVAPNRRIKILKSGWLLKRSHNMSRDWNDRFFVLTDESLNYAHERFDLQDVEHIECRFTSINLLTVTAKPVPECPRRFLVVTCLREYLLEAETPGEASLWIHQINSASHDAILGQTQQVVPSRDQHLTRISGGTSLVSEIQTAAAGNIYCADCRLPNPTWVSLNLGITLCISCSGVHRSLGCQVSKVRSLDLDRFTLESIALLKALGNDIINSFLEADVPKELQLPYDASDEQRRDYIKAKYCLRSFSQEAVDVASPRPLGSRKVSPLHSPAKRLFEVVTKTKVADTAEMLFAYGVDVNTVDGLTGESALHAAARAGKALQVHFLLLNGADPTIMNKVGLTPLDVALQHKDDNTTMALLYEAVHGGSKLSLPSTASISSDGAAPGESHHRHGRMKGFYAHPKILSTTLRLIYPTFPNRCFVYKD